jgi:hydroxymethylglutaryl-CoA reductase (NADPH)
MKALRLCGGVKVFVEESGITRAPVFRVKNLTQAIKFEEWIGKNEGKLKMIAEATSKHLHLKKLNIQRVGRNVFLRFSFETAEAMGMNMVTIACEAASRMIEKETGCKCISLSGNYCSDKKVAGVNFIAGRGKQVWAEAELSEEVIKQVLKTRNEDLWEVYFRKICIGSATAGMMGANGHYANVIAAVFAATGQDLAQTVEGSLGITTMEKVNKGVYVSVYLPDLVVGTVGGGTGLPSQKTALGIMGLGKTASGEAKVLAEIIGGTVLAGEISLLAALASGDLAKAHRSLGRRGGVKNNEV